ncbi:MAG: DNA-3-methyladenine glycosylase I [Bacteroidia bacterium]|jgi:DNA-3-methyladenine glycosylase I|nr:DNA-3-methyladenine glycosylase I [Bacteroidia bacterium]
MEINYIEIFDIIEKTLKQKSGLSNQQFADKYSSFRNLTFKNRTDDEYFNIIKLIIFYSGFKANIVNNKTDIINKFFPDYKTVSFFGDNELTAILSDDKMIKNRRKIIATINNAKTLKSLVKQYGSFQSYIDSFSPRDSFENLMLLKEELEFRFDYLGDITVYHFLTDIGLDALKPDRVLIRIFQRLGLIESEKQLLKTVIQGRKFAAATGHSIRYIDIIFVRYGQQGKEGICFTKNPKCKLCGLTEKCNFYKQLVDNNEI